MLLSYSMVENGRLLSNLGIFAVLKVVSGKQVKSWGYWEDVSTDVTHVL